MLSFDINFLCLSNKSECPFPYLTLFWKFRLAHSSFSLFNPMFLCSLFFSVLLESSCSSSLVSCFHKSSFSNSIHPSCLPGALTTLCAIPGILSLLSTTYYNVSCTKDHSPKPFHYPSAHLACLPITHLSCCT